MRQFFAGIVLLLSTSAAPAAQVPAPTREAGRLRTGTAHIVGRVVDGVSGLPVARARVRVEGLPHALPPVGTDDQGGFDIAGLPRCACTIAVDKAGYVATRYPDATPTFRGSHQTILIVDGATTRDVVVRLYRGGSMAGRVVDAFGEPVESARVQVLKIESDGHATPRGGASTDDLGDFRVARLVPGRYLLFVEHRNQADDPNPSQPVPTFYPGVADLTQAQTIAVDRGQAVTGLDLSLLAGTAAWVSGTVLAEDGTPATGPGVFMTARRIGTSGMDLGVVQVELPGDGTFRAKLPPGDYQLDARSSGQPAVDRAGPPDERMGSLQVAVNGTPTSNLTVQLGPGATMTGRIVFDGDGPRPERGGFADAIAASFTAPPGADCRRGSGRSQPEPPVHASTESDWSFRIRGLFGTCITSMAAVNLKGWSVTGLWYGDIDLFERPVTFQPGQVFQDLRLILSDRRSSLTIQVADAHGLPTREYVALLFSVDPARWTVNSHFMRIFQPPAVPPDAPTGAATITDGRGVDTISGALPGDYYAIALDDLSFEAIRNPAILERLAKSSTRLTIGVRATGIIDLHRESFDELMKR
jgi:hypothetical protein